MALGLIVAGSVLVTTFGLVLGLTKLNESECEKTKRDDEHDLTELKESERERIIELFEKETCEEWTFDVLRKYRYTGFTNRYLRNEFSIEDLSTTASLEVVLDLVKLDLAEGAKPEEIVFVCCQYWPSRDVVSAVMKETGAKIENVLKYENKIGCNCLMIMLDALVKHEYKTEKDPVGTKVSSDIERSILYLVELGDKQGLNMNKILEKTDKTGQTLMSLSSPDLRNLTSELLERKVNAKSINLNFATPQFKFKSLHRPMIAAGVNPFAFTLSNYTQADYNNVLKDLVSELNPDLTPDLYFSTTSLPCNSQTCDESCKQGLPDPWYYNNGMIWDFKKTDCIGKGAEGIVLSGKFHGREAAFKMVEIKNLKTAKFAKEALNDLRTRLSEMYNLSKTNGQNILPFYGHIRQQLSTKNGNKMRFEVFITKKCEFNLADLKKSGIEVDEAKDIIDQLIDAQEQLQAAGVSHNDIKPSNILVDWGDQTMYKIYIQGSP